MKIRRSREPADILNITPLIDVVFILLVFFMLAGSIEQPPVLNVAPPVSASDEAGAEEDVVILIDEDGVVAFQGRVMRDDPELLRTATVWFAARPQSSIQLKADTDAEAVRVIEVMELLREAGAQYLVLITVGGS